MYNTKFIIEKSYLCSQSKAMKRLHPIMLAGTGSDVGKSILATALCRILRQDGYRPAPFKAQNMALNSFVTPDGLEIGRAQAVQAEAAGIPCEADMNPLLLKPQSDHTSQVVLMGRPIGSLRASEYWRRQSNEALRTEVCRAFDRLAARFNPIVMEGAGSIAELNLRATDLVNMSMARHADADVLLVADIDRGGVFASVYGSIMLQDEEDRRRIKGIIVNKFRGDLHLFDDGRRMLEDITGVPVLGVVPYLKDLHIEEEDSVDLNTKSGIPQRSHDRVHIAVVRLPYISNYTDFDALEHDARIHLYYITCARELQEADIVVLPGTKSTLADLHWLHQSGMAEAVLRARREGKTVLGICGGYQMMGREVLDPQHVEGSLDHMPGLGLLPTVTTMTGEKRTRQVVFRLKADASIPCSPASYTMKGYEIHMGETHVADGDTVRPLVEFEDGTAEGCYIDEHCMGTYIHGILDNSNFVDLLLRPFAEKVATRHTDFDYHAFKEQQYDLLADHVRRHLDMQQFYNIING